MKRTLALNPDNKPATLSDIKKYRDIHEEAEILTEWGYIDADFLSLNRLGNASANFTALPNLDMGRVKWTFADNTTVFFYENELVDLYNYVSQESVLRSALLHEKYNYFKTLATYPTLSQIKSIDFWLS